MITENATQATQATQSPTTTTTSTAASTANANSFLTPLVENINALKDGQYQSALKRVTELFDTRIEGHKLSTIGYQTTQRRLLPLLALPKGLWSTVFLATVRETESFATGESYWTALSTVARALGIGPAEDHAKVARYLHAQCQARQPISKPHVLPSEIRALPSLSPALFLAARTAYALGQRISDTLLLQKDCVRIIGPTLALTFREGKVIPKIGPYTLHLPLNHDLSRPLLQLKGSRDDYPFLFLDRGITQAMASATIGKALASLRPGLDARSLRRGGLMAMARAGWPDEEICFMSKHATVAMLNKYLCAGAYSTAGMEISCRMSNPTN
jgi:integrase